MLTGVRGILLLLAGATAFAQQISFTSRTCVQCPAAIVSIEESKDFGFNAIALRNDGARAITAVRLLITFHAGGGDEIADERRVPLKLGLHDTQRIILELGQIAGLRQLARSRGEASALAILTIESLEFADGSEWKESERDQGAPADPLEPPPNRPKK